MEIIDPVGRSTTTIFSFVKSFLTLRAFLHLSFYKTSQAHVFISDPVKNI